jgi:hypothetical protein
VPAQREPLRAARTTIGEAKIRKRRNRQDLSAARIAREIKNLALETGLERSGC